MTQRSVSTSVVFLLLALAFSGCTAPSITAPVGTSWDKEVVKSLEGVWEGEKDEYMLVNMGDDGKLYLGLMEFDPKAGKYEVETVEVTLARLGDNDFAFLKMGDFQGCFFLRIVDFDTNSVRVRAPDDELFVKAIKQDKSLGEVLRSSRKSDESERALVTAEGGAFSRILQEYGSDACFPNKDEIVFRRVVAQKNDAVEKPEAVESPPDNEESQGGDADRDARKREEIKNLIARANNPHMTYEELAEEADTIVIATLVELMVRSDVDYRDEAQIDAADSARILSVDSRFAVKTVLKGVYHGKHLTVAHLQQPNGIDLGSERLVTFHKQLKAPMITTHQDDDRVGVVYAPGTEFEEMVPEYLLFLKRRKDGLYEPASGQARASDAVRIVNLVEPQ